jgi:hypothetical protein
MYMSSPVLVNGRVVGLSHWKRGQYFGLDPATGRVEWKSEPGQGQNAAFVVADGALLVLQGDGTLLVTPPSGASFSSARRYHVGESATYAHPIPTELGILVKDESGLALYGPEVAGGGASGSARSWAGGYRTPPTWRTSSSRCSSRCTAGSISSDSKIASTRRATASRVAPWPTTSDRRAAAESFRPATARTSRRCRPTTTGEPRTSPMLAARSSRASLRSWVRFPPPIARRSFSPRSRDTGWPTPPPGSVSRYRG